MRYKRQSVEATSERAIAQRKSNKLQVLRTLRRAWAIARMDRSRSTKASLRSASALEKDLEYSQWVRLPNLYSLSSIE